MEVAAHEAPGMEEGSKPSTLVDAINNVASLVEIDLHPIDESCIESPDFVFGYEAHMDTAFMDKEAFKKVASRFEDETTHQVKLNELLEKGQQFANMLYTWRSCSFGIPPIKSNEQHNRLEIYQTTVDVLEPEVDKLRAFMLFQREAVAQFVDDVKHLCQDKKDFVSEGYLLTLGKFISLFTVMDELKNIKASCKNDFSTYKRASGILKRFTDPHQLEQMEHLSMFLAMHGSILTQVKTAIQEIHGVDDLISDVINTCVQMYENHVYLLPEEKYGIMKVLGFCLYLMDGDKWNINKIDGKKKLQLSKIDKIFKQVEVVPLFGDMMIGPFKYIERTPNFDPDKWTHCMSEEKTSPQSELLKQIPHLRQEHTQLVCKLAWLGHVKDQVEKINIKYNKEQMKTMKLGKSDEDYKELYNLALDSLQKLASWRARITELFSWKLLHPTDPEYNKQCPKDAAEYEKATRYNYSSAEKSALVELIAMLKGVQQILVKSEYFLSAVIKRHIYSTLQEFVQVQLREPLRKATKHKKENIRNILCSIRAICSDLLQDKDDPKDILITKLKKDSETGYKLEYPRKPVTPSSTQLYLVRTMLEALVEKGDKSVGRKALRKDMDAQHVQAIEAFLQQSFYWPYMSSYTNSIRACCDLSQLWYREIYLEMTRGARMQFPIEMSMPWILTDHILKSEDHSMLEYVLFPLDLYNDSANYALYSFKKQFLYEEIEAEVNLCFDQFVFKLSEQIFEYFKWKAGCIVLDQTFADQCQKLGFKVKRPPRTRYHTFLKKQHVQILGRSVDLQKLIVQRLNESFLKALSIAISRFEASDITGIMELEGLLKVNREAHKQLCQYVRLTSFDSLLNEANRSVNLPVGRITLHVFSEVNYDFLPQYCYNAATNRFVRTVFPFADTSEREKPPTTAHYNLFGNRQLTQCFTAIYGLYTNFVGQPHFGAMLNLLAYQDIAVILQQLMEVINNIVQVTVLPYIRTLAKVMPQRCKLPRFDYTSPGILEYFMENLKDIRLYSDLQPKVFQVLREMGNAVLFCILLEHAVTQREVVELTHAALFLNVIPKPYVPKKEKTSEERYAEVKTLLKKSEEKYRHMKVVPLICDKGSEEQKEIIVTSARLSREKLCCGLSIAQVVLKRIVSFLDDDLWQGQMPANGVLDVVENTEFHRFWSALQFVFCIPPRGPNEYTIEQLFGEGLNWAGCTLIVLLGQQRRFEVMDYGYYLLKVHKVDQMDKDCTGVPLRKMVDRIRKFQILNDQIFSVLNKYLQAGSSDAFGVQVCEMPPPSKELALPTQDSFDDGADPVLDISETPGNRESIV